MLKDFFAFVEHLNNGLDNKIREISIKKSKITFTFEDSIILSRKDFNLIDRLYDSIKISEIATFQDVLFVSFTNLSQDIIPQNFDTQSLLYLYLFIFELQDILCTCPALEFVISDSYLKIYIDVPNLHAKDIIKVDKKLKQDGILELNQQRPYVLYVKDW